MDNSVLYSTALLLYPWALQELLSKIIRYVYISNVPGLLDDISAMILLLDEYISTQTEEDINELQRKCWSDAVSGVIEEYNIDPKHHNIHTEIPEELDIRKLLDHMPNVSDYLEKIIAREDFYGV